MRDSQFPPFPHLENCIIYGTKPTPPKGGSKMIPTMNSNIVVKHNIVENMRASKPMNI